MKEKRVVTALVDLALKLVSHTDERYDGFCIEPLEGGDWIKSRVLKKNDSQGHDSTI